MRRVVHAAQISIGLAVVLVGARTYAQNVPAATSLRTEPAMSGSPAPTSPGTGRIVGGAVLTALGTTGVVFGGLFFWVEWMVAASSPVIPPATPNHALSISLWVGSSALLGVGIPLLVVGIRQAVAVGRAPARVGPGVTMWTPAGGAGLALHGVF